MRNSVTLGTVRHTQDPRRQSRKKTVQCKMPDEAKGKDIDIARSCRVWSVHYECVPWGNKPRLELGMSGMPPPPCRGSNGAIVPLISTQPRGQRGRVTLRATPEAPRTGVHRAPLEPPRLLSSWPSASTARPARCSSSCSRSRRAPGAPCHADFASADFASAACLPLDPLHGLAVFGGVEPGASLAFWAMCATTLSGEAPGAACSSASRTRISDAAAS